MTDPRQLLDHYQRNYSATPEELFFALGAVLDLHAPHPGMPLADTWCMHCLDESLGPRWPCPTVRKITAALEAK